MVDQLAAIALALVVALAFPSRTSGELDQYMYGKDFLASNNVESVAVDKLSYLPSDGGVGSYSHFADGETWW